MAKLPMTRPVYMAELGRRMGMTSREARTVLRKIEHARKVKLLFDSRTERQGRLWTTEALLAKHCPELFDRPKRALGEVRQFVRRVSEKIDELEKEVASLKTQQEEELSLIRAELRRAIGTGST